MDTTKNTECSLKLSIGKVGTLPDRVTGIGHSVFLEALHARDELGYRGHIRGLLELAYCFDEGCCLPDANDRGREASELVTDLIPGKGVVWSTFVGLRREGIALTSVFEQYLGLQGGWASVRGILQDHQFDTLRQVAYHRVAHCLFVVDQGVGQITRERDRGGEWQAVLPSHDALRCSHGVAFFHDPWRPADHHACNVRWL